MSDPTIHPEPRGETAPFDSVDSAVVIVDGPGDTTVQPLSPEYIRKMLEWRQRLGLPPLPKKEPSQDKPGAS